MEFNLAQVQEGLAGALGERDVMVCGDRRLSGLQFNDRTRRLANHLLDRGLSVHRERSELRPHESGQDHVGLYLHNGSEYLEGLFGAAKARAAAFNVNWRYTAEELRYLLADARARAVIYHGEFTPQLAEVLPALPDVTVLLRVDDRSCHPLLPGAVNYEDALASASSSRPDLDWSPDDVYVLYTGGTTGLPKGVLWRQADAFAGALGGWDTRGNRREWDSLDELVRAALERPVTRILPAPPFMHGSGHWPACQALFAGGTVVVPTEARRLDPASVWDAAQEHAVGALVIVGDAFARPLLEEFSRSPRDLPALRAVINGGAILTRESQEKILRLLPDVSVVNTMGSSESGAQARGRARAGASPTPNEFRPYAGTCVVDEELRSVLPPGHDGVGWLATEGRIPLGYLGDPEKTARTFPVIDSTRRVVPGDRARHRADGFIELLGRDSVTINSGGEKIFVEEVEAALLAHPSVADTTVVGRPSARWGSEVVALVQLRTDASATPEELLAAASARVARYKLPKQILFVERIQRSPAGKADYRWARAQAIAGDEEDAWA